jgi:inner membrane protein
VALDLDGLGLVAEVATRNSDQPLFWWSEYHHVLGHNLLFALLLAAVAWVHFRKLLVAGSVAAMVHLHLLGDLVGSRGPDGYQWPISYLWPFSSWPSLAVPWQWKLNAWPNVALSVALLSYTLWFAWRAGTSPLALFSARTNTALVQALRSRFGSPAQRHSIGGPA